LSQIEAWEDAEKTYQTARELRPDSVGPYLGIGHIYRLQKEYKEARIWYEEALTKAPNNFDALFFLGFVHYHLQDYNLAQRYFKHALDLKPTHLESAYYLDQILKQSGEPKGPFEDLNKAK
jgi:tetratricopeptide (TPR) repeat protein